MFVSKFTISIRQTDNGFWQAVMLRPFADHTGNRVWARGRWDHRHQDQAEQEALLWAAEEQLRYVPPTAQDQDPVAIARRYALAS